MTRAVSGLLLVALAGLLTACGVGDDHAPGFHVRVDGQSWVPEAEVIRTSLPDYILQFKWAHKETTSLVQLGQFRYGEAEVPCTHLDYVVLDFLGDSKRADLTTCTGTLHWSTPLTPEGTEAVGFIDLTADTPDHRLRLVGEFAASLKE